MSSSPPGGGATRDVRPGSRVEAILRHAGLTPAEVPAGPDGGRYVTEAEVLAEIDRRGLQVTVPEQLPPLSEKAARRYVRKLHSLGRPHPAAARRHQGPGGQRLAGQPAGHRGRSSGSGWPAAATSGSCAAAAAETAG